MLKFDTFVPRILKLISGKKYHVPGYDFSDTLYFLVNYSYFGLGQYGQFMLIKTTN